MRSRVLALTLCIFVLGGCDRTAAPVTDGGPASDSGPSDRIAPTVRDTTPSNGETGVLRDAQLVVRFSEPMSPLLGTVRIEPGVGTLAAMQGEWDEAGNVLTLTPTRPWPSGEVTLTFDTEFADLAGNALEEHVVVFETVDDIAPTVVDTTPTQDATGVSARTAEIVIRFDEPMRTGMGTLDLLGGSATLGAASWSADATTVTFAVADLEYERDYDVTLRSFVDANGNRLIAGDYLDDNVLDFTTGTDSDGPRVVRSEPAEGQVDVDPADLSAILVTFDEVMDTTVRDVSLSDGTGDVTVTGTWTDSGRILRLPTAGLLAFGTSYSLDLTDLRDRAGNPIDAATYLVDGRLDFTVGLDEFLPFVRASSPIENEPDVSYSETTEVVLTFSEAMDTSITTATLSGGPAPITLTGTWRGTTELALDVEGDLAPGAMMSIDLRSMRDLRGNALSTTHRYLNDGRLDFSTGAPIGEGCRDPLTMAEATDTAGVYSWSLSSLQGSVRDGGTAACDISATSANGTDVLVRFDKVSGTTATGGRYLRIVLDGATATTTGTNAFDVGVMTGACDPTAAPLRCQSNAALQDHLLDLPAGPVWIWVARTSLSTSSAGAVLTVSEVEPPRIEGDSCEAPFTTASSVHTAMSGMVHRFSIPQNALRSVDIGPYSYEEPNLFSCDTAAGHGIDGVIRFDKTEASSILRVSARRTAGSDSMNFAVFDACDPSAPTARELGCRTGITTTAQEFLVDAPAGPLHLWVSDTLTSVSRSSTLGWLTSNAIEVDVQVIPDVQAGEICSRAIAASAGANAVGGTSDQRLNAPSCFGATSNVEWYRVTSAQEVLFVSADAAGGLAMLDPGSSAEIACVPNGSTRTLTRVLPVGTSVCVGVEMGRGISSINISGQSYDGLGSTAPVDLGILRPLNVAGTAEESVTSDYWMGVTGSNLLMRHISSAIMDVSRSGGERAVRRGTDDGIVTSTSGSSIQNVGATAVVMNGALFTFNTATATTGTRVHRMWNGVTPTWRPTAWDLGSTYPAAAIVAAAQDGANDILYVTGGTAPSFYRISTLGPSTPQSLGSSTRLESVRGIAVDDEYVYVSATVATQRGIWRVPRSDIAAEPYALARTTSFSTSTTQATPMALDSLTDPRNLYVRNANGEVEAIIDPDAAVPFYLGPVIERGRAGDWAMTLDVATGQLYLFETETDVNGTWLRYDP